VSSGLRWDASGLPVRFQDSRAEQLRFAGVTGNDAQNLEHISASIFQEALQALSVARVSTGSACTLPCAARPTTARCWNN